MKKLIIFFIVLLGVILPSKSQNSNVEMPSFPGGSGALSTYLANNVRYPKVAEENGVEGRVVCLFVVQRDGTITDVSVARSIDPSLDKEAMRVISNMPKWKPGRKDGTPVQVKYSLPISFKLPGGSSSNRQQARTNSTQQRTIASNSSTSPRKLDGVKSIEDVFKGTHDDGKYVYFNTSNQPGKTKKLALNDYDFEGVLGPVFHDGMLGVINKENRCVGFVNEQGNLLPGGFKWWYDLDFFPRFGGGAALVYTAIGSGSRAVKTWYIIDKNGTTIKLNLGGSIHKAGNFNDDGIACIILEKRNAKGLKTYTKMYINTKGQQVFRNLWAGTDAWSDSNSAPIALGTFNDGLAKFCKGNKYGFVNRSGVIVIPAQYDEAEDFSEELAVVQTEINGARKYIYIDINGSRAIQIAFTTKPGNFHKGFAPVKKANGMYNYINKSGQQQLNNDVYGATEFFPNGCALVKVNNTASSEVTAVITTQFNKHVQFRHDLIPYDKEDSPQYWNGLALIRETFAIGYKFLDFNTGTAYVITNMEDPRVASDNLITGKMKVTYHDQKTAFANINGCRWVFYIDKDEF